MSARLAAAGLSAALVGCGPVTPPDPVEQLTAELSRREGHPVEVQAIARRPIQGRTVACGYFATPMTRGQRLPAATSTFATINGRLVSDEAGDLKPFVEACMQTFPRRPAIYD